MSTESKSRDSLVRLIKMVSPYKGQVVLSGLFSILAEGCGIIPFILVYFVVKEIAGRQLAEINQQFIWYLVFAGIGAVIFRHVFLGLSMSLSHKIAYGVLYDLRVRISEKLATLPLGYFNARTTGQIKKVMLEDVEQMEVFIGHNMPEFTGSFIHLVLSTAVLFVFDWLLALATICMWPIGVFAQIAIVSTGKNKKLIAQYYTANENVNAAMVQYIQGMPIIKAFNHTIASFKKYSMSVQDSARCEDTLCERYFFPMTIFSVVITANMLVLLPVGAMMYMAGSITLSTFTLFLLIGLGLGAPLFNFITLGGTMARNLEGKERIDAILNAEPLLEPVVEKEANDDAVLAQHVEFSFKEKKVLKGIDFEIPAKKFMALVGPSGAGKTTIARLIPRFWDVDAGSISLGKTDIRDMKIDDLMDKITFVFQDIYLFNDSIYDNLRMGKPDATQEEVENAATAAQCHDFITSLPDGYQSFIGEKGVRISGGEKQRLSIARALLKNAPIIVLDEATAFIDPENEALIQEAIDALARDKTLIVIAHRLSTITGANQILVVNEGKIVERGTHEQLLEGGALYKSMWYAHVSSLGWNF